MSTIVTRNGKGTALTWTEMDSNFTNLNTDKIQSGDNVTLGNVTVTSINSSTYVGLPVFNGTTDGVVNAGSNSGTLFLRDDATWAAPSAGLAGGSNTQVQFNDGSVLAGNASLTFDKTTGVFTLGSVPTKGYNSGASGTYIIGMSATPVQWNNTGNYYGYQLGTKSFLISKEDGSNLTASLGMRINSAGNYVYTTTGLTPSWLEFSGGQMAFLGAASGTAGNTITPSYPLIVDATTNSITTPAASITTANITTANITTATVTTLSVAGNNISADHGFVRNRIINGDMRINQRYGTTTTTATAGVNTYTLDRWNLSNGTTAGTLTAASTTTSPPAGFTTYTRVTATVADASLGATENSAFIQVIEGNNIADLDWGLSTAKTVTLSFWIRSSLTGTFGGSFKNSAANRSYPFTYVINAANTWEQKTVTIAGDTTGTWLTDTGIGVQCVFDLGTGSTYRGTAGAWAAANYVGVTGAVSMISTTNATWDITGVQFEVGSVASPFERRSYGNELVLCQRYFYKMLASGANQYVGSGLCQNATLVYAFISFPVTMRTEPAIGTDGTAAHYAVLYAGGGIVCSAVPSIAAAGVWGNLIAFPVAAGLTAGQGAMGYIGTASAYLSWSAEY